MKVTMSCLRQLLDARWDAIGGNHLSKLQDSVVLVAGMTQMHVSGKPSLGSTRYPLPSRAF